MSRFMNRLRQSVDGLLAPAPPPTATVASPAARLHAQLVRVQASRQRLEQTSQALGERQQALEQRAMRLHTDATNQVTAGRTDLARLALTHRRTTLVAVETLAKQRAELHAHTARIIPIEQQLLARIDAIAQHRDLMTAQQQAALAQIELGETLTGLNEVPTFATSDGIDDAAVESLQAQATAIRRLIDDGLIDLHLVDDPLVDTDLQATIEAELATIQRRVSEQSRT